MTRLLYDILNQPDSLRAVCRYQSNDGREAILRAAGLLRQRPRVIVSGMGASFFAGIGFTYILNSRGVPAQAIDASELLYFLESLIDADTAVALISRSGESVEATRLLERIGQRGGLAIGLTNVPDSTLATSGAASIYLASAPDELVAIQTYTATVLTLSLLEAAISGKFERRTQDLMETCDVLSEWIPYCTKARDTFDPFLSLNGPCYLLGRGASLGSVAEGVLLMHEAAKTGAIGMGVAQFRHGPVEAVDEGFHAVILGTQHRTANIDAALANDLAGMGGHVRWLGPPVAGCTAPPLCPWPNSIPSHGLAIAETIPLQLLAYRQAELNGVPPGKFRWAPQVTTTESGFERYAMKVLCVDIGGTSTKAGVLQLSGEPVTAEAIPSRPPIEDYFSALRTLINDARARAGEPVSCIGVSVAGFLDDDRTSLVYNSNLPWLENFPLRERLSAAFPNLDIELEVDSNAAAIAEYRLGCGRGSHRFLCVTCGTGVGVGMIVNGHPLRVAYGCLGDMGHVIVQKDGPLCTCGGRGCAEALISAPVLAQRFKELAGIDRTVGLRDVIEAGQSGNSTAIRVLSQAGEWLGVAIASMANILFPDRIAIAGGLCAAGELILKSTERAFRDSAGEKVRSRAKLEIATLGPSASLAGAGLSFSGTSSVA